MGCLSGAEITDITGSILNLLGGSYSVKEARHAEFDMGLLKGTGVAELTGSPCNPLSASLSVKKAGQSELKHEQVEWETCG